MKKLMIWEATKKVMDNLPIGIETLIIYHLDLNTEEKIENLPSTLQHIYIVNWNDFDDNLYDCAVKYLTKLPFGCSIKCISMSSRKGEDIKYYTEEDDKILKYPVFSYSKADKKYVPIEIKKEWESPEYVYSISREYLDSLKVQ